MSATVKSFKYENSRNKMQTELDLPFVHGVSVAKVPM